MSFTIRIVHGVKHQLPEHSQSFDVDLKIAFIILIKNLTKNEPFTVGQGISNCLFKTLNLSFNKISEPEYRKDVLIQLLNGGCGTADLWVIPYTYTVFQEEDDFIYLDDRYFALMYITTPHGYIRG